MLVRRVGYLQTYFVVDRSHSMCKCTMSKTTTTFDCSRNLNIRESGPHDTWK